jgi:hypothetical protein
MRFCLVEFFSSFLSQFSQVYKLEYNTLITPEVRNQIAKELYSRIPVYIKDEQNLVGTH